MPCGTSQSQRRCGATRRPVTGFRRRGLKLEMRNCLAVGKRKKPFAGQHRYALWEFTVSGANGVVIFTIPERASARPTTDSVHACHQHLARHQNRKFIARFSACNPSFCHCMAFITALISLLVKPASFRAGDKATYRTFQQTVNPSPLLHSLLICKPL